MKKTKRILYIAIMFCSLLLFIGGMVSCIVNIAGNALTWLLLLIVVITIGALFHFFRNKRSKNHKREQSAQSKTQPNLSPVILKKGDPNYYSVELLKKKLSAGSANNIAVTGIYGSGKSSVLETLKRIDTEHKFLTISLAKLSGKKDIEESQIEYSILQQIFYREDQSQFPFSKINKIALRSKKDIVWFALNVLVLSYVWWYYLSQSLSKFPLYVI